MSGSDRGASFAVGLICGISICVLFALLFSPWFSDPTNQQITQIHPKGGNWDQKQEGFGTIPPAFVSTQDTLAQWIMAILAFFATGISIWAVLLIRETLQVTQETVTEAQKATREAEKATRATEGAFETAVEDFNTRNPPRIKAAQIYCEVKVGEPLKGSLFLINEGGTNAILAKPRSEDTPWLNFLHFHIGKNTPTKFPDAEIGYSGVIQKKNVIVAGEAFQWTFSVPVEMHEELFKEIFLADKKIFMMGIVRFTDGTKSKAEHRTLFCRQYIPTTKRWVHTNDPDYEYQT